MQYCTDQSAKKNLGPKLVEEAPVNMRFANVKSYELHILTLESQTS